MRRLGDLVVRMADESTDVRKWLFWNSEENADFKPTALRPTMTPLSETNVILPQSSIFAQKQEVENPEEESKEALVEQMNKLNLEEKKE